MRTIDADDLKETISEEVCRKFVRWDKTITVAEFETFVSDVIDNAPTVESICPYLSDNEVKQPCLDSPCERPQGDLISREALRKELTSETRDEFVFVCLSRVLEKIDKAQVVKEERPQGECRTCRHRDPEDKKCDCGALERHGCPFPVSDDYFCKYYEKGGAE